MINRTRTRVYEGEVNLMKKSYSNMIMFVSILLNVVFLVFSINHYFNLGSKDEISKTYESFYNSVQSLDWTLDLVDTSTEDKKITENMYLSNTRLNFVSDRFIFLENSINGYTQLNLPDIKNKLSLLKYGYESFMLSQILGLEAVKSEEFRELKEQIKDFSENLPEKYSNSKAFVQKFNNAVELLYYH